MVRSGLSRWPAVTGEYAPARPRTIARTAGHTSSNSSPAGCSRSSSSSSSRTRGAWGCGRVHVST